MALEHSSTERFANSIANSGDLLSSVPQNISSRQEAHVFWMAEIIASLDGRFCWPEHYSDRQRAELSINSRAFARSGT
jgi:hypothetical protein